jgi:predicted Fe-Mo cluster-binding NifX family protein
MKIIVSAMLPNLQSKVDPRRFGRSAYLLEVDTESLEYKAHLNPGLGAWGKTGIHAAQFVIDRNASAVVSGEFDTRVNIALDDAGVVMYRFQPRGTVADAITSLKAGALERVGAVVRPD